MIKKLMSAVLVLAMLACPIALSSCKTQLVYENGTFYCAKTDVNYKELDFQYLPVSINGEKYGQLNENGTKTDIFSISGAAPEKWLATADGRLFCAVEEEIPTLEEMNADKILICKEGSELTISVAEITSVVSIAEIVGSLTGGVRVEYPEKGETSELLSLRFSSSKYPWLYYSVAYVEFESDVIVTDYVSDPSAYVEREIDDTVEKSESFTFDCWYKLSADGIEDKISEISENTGIPCATVTMVNSEGGKDEYIGLLFSDMTELDECIEAIIELYDGEMSEADIAALLSDPDIIDNKIAYEYNYGKYLVYDRATGMCVKAPQCLHEYKELTRFD